MGAILDRVPPGWLAWEPGPDAAADGPVVVSATEFTPHSARHVHAFALDGLRLRRGWYGMPGAVGLRLYGQLTRRRGGSVSVWTSRAALQRFIGLPRHVEIMRKYRPLGIVRSTTWTQERFDREEIQRRAERWLAELPPVAG